MAKQWKENPPGEPQRELDRLFKEKLIDESDSAIKIRQTNPIFQEFSSRVFCTHFRKTRAKHGFFANGGNPVEEDEAAIELGLAKAYCNRANTSQASSSPYITNTSIESTNEPIMTWVYTNHAKKCDFVCVAMPIISGSTNVTFTLSEDGMMLTITYDWPSAMVKPLQLLHKQINDRVAPMSLDNPKLHSLQSHLLDLGMTEKAKPQGKCIITLPVKVQRENDSWTKSGITSDDAQILLLEFQAYQKKPVIDDADTLITFN